jgi:hypothetical protein
LLDGVRWIISIDEKAACEAEQTLKPTKCFVGQNLKPKIVFAPQS